MFNGEILEKKISPLDGLETLLCFFFILRSVSDKF